MLKAYYIIPAGGALQVRCGDYAGTDVLLKTCKRVETAERFAERQARATGQKISRAQELPGHSKQQVEEIVSAWLVSTEPDERLGVAEALALFKKRGVSCSRQTLHRWLVSGSLAAEWHPASRRYYPYRGAVENFTPPKRGNPAIAKLRRKTLRKKK